MGLSDFFKSILPNGNQKATESLQEPKAESFDKLEKKLELNRRIEEEGRKYEENRKIYNQNKKEKFSEYLNNALPFSIFLSDEKFPKNKVADMPEIKYSNIIKTTNPETIQNFIVVDVETTGLSARDEIIELSAIKFRNFSPVEVFTTLIKPKKEIPPEATRVNHITNDMVLSSPTINQITPAFLEFIADTDILVGHNLEFDLKFLHVWGINFHNEKRKYYDTLSLSRRTIETSDRSYSLDSICQEYNIFRDNAHRATSDCLATGILFVELAMERIPREKFSFFPDILKY